jgi:hypothetical protein
LKKEETNLEDKSMIGIDTLCSVCTTKHYEFVIYDSLCVAVRDKRSGVWLSDHDALDERIALVPCALRTAGTARWDLRIYCFGLELNLGPVLTVSKPDATVTRRLREQTAHSPRLRSAAARYVAELGEPF